MFGFTLLSVALVASQVAASTISSRSPLVSLLRTRQGSSFDPSSVPSQCRSDCSDISAALTSTSCSQDITCICSTSASRGLYTCLQCALSLQPDEDVLEQAQESYNEYAQACASGNEPVEAQTLTLPGGSSASATGAPRGSGTAAASGTRTSTAAGRTITAADPTGTSSTTDGDDGDDGSDTDSGSSGGLKHNSARVGAAVSSVGLAGVAAMVALLVL